MIPVLHANVRAVLHLYSVSENMCRKIPKRTHSTLDPLQNFKKMTTSSIIVSLSRDVYRNLALEDWLYKNYDFSSKQIYLLLMWYNCSSVVIGRHQNPWIECSMDFSLASGISVVRRNSGGGTVYHDLGNLNCSFMSCRSKYDRKSNLNMICEALQKKWPLNLSVSKREDILLDEKYKGFQEQLQNLALHRELSGIDSKATTSIRSEVKNLKSACPEISVPEVITAIGKEYQSIYKVPKDSLYKIEPSEDVFPGIQSIEDHLKSWEWCFGKTPLFHITRSFPLCPSFSKWEGKQMPKEFELKISVLHGCISNFVVTPDVMDELSLDNLKNSLIGVQFSPSITHCALEQWATVFKDTVLNRYIKICILQMVLDMHR